MGAPTSQCNGLKEISAKGRRGAGVEGDFLGPSTKTGEEESQLKGKGAKERGGERGVDESALFCCANVTSDCYWSKRLVIGGLV